MRIRGTLGRPMRVSFADAQIQVPTESLLMSVIGGGVLSFVEEVLVTDW